MRTTITLPDELIEQTLKMSGKKRLSDAIATVLDEQIRRHKRLAFMEKLSNTRLPHRQADIKAERKRGSWSVNGHR